MAALFNASGWTKAVIPAKRIVIGPNESEIFLPKSSVGVGVGAGEVGGVKGGAFFGSGAPVSGLGANFCGVRGLGVKGSSAISGLALKILG